MKIRYMLIILIIILFIALWAYASTHRTNVNRDMNLSLEQGCKEFVVVYKCDSGALNTITVDYKDMNNKTYSLLELCDLMQFNSSSACAAACGCELRNY